MNRLRMGITGAGGITTVHLNRLRDRGDAVELVGIADINLDAAKARAEQYGIARATTDYREFLPDIDAMLICIPTNLHADVAIAALQAGKAVFCEKPLTRTWEQAQAVSDAVAASGKPLQIGFVRRFDSSWLGLRDAVQAAKIGRPLSWRQIQTARPGGGWYNVDEMGGGPFLDGAIHTVDFALHTFGPAQWVFAHLRTLDPQQTAQDTGTATIRFASGDELLLVWSWGLPRGVKSDGIFDFMGPQGRIAAVPGETGDQTELHFRIDRGENIEPELIAYPTDSIIQAFNAQMDEFIEVAQGRARPRAGLTAAREALEVCLAILESGRKQELIRL